VGEDSSAVCSLRILSEKKVANICESVIYRPQWLGSVSLFSDELFKIIAKLASESNDNISKNFGYALVYLIILNFFALQQTSITRL